MYYCYSTECIDQTFSFYCSLLRTSFSVCCAVCCAPQCAPYSFCVASICNFCSLLSLCVCARHAARGALGHCFNRKYIHFWKREIECVCVCAARCDRAILNNKTQKKKKTYYRNSACFERIVLKIMFSLGFLLLVTTTSACAGASLQAIVLTRVNLFEREESTWIQIRKKKTSRKKYFSSIQRRQPFIGISYVLAISTIRFVFFLLCLSLFAVC